MMLSNVQYSTLKIDGKRVIKEWTILFFHKVDAIRRIEK